MKSLDKAATHLHKVPAKAKKDVYASMLEVVVNDFESKPLDVRESLVDYASTVASVINFTSQDFSPLVGHLNGSNTLSPDLFPNTSEVCDSKEVVNTQAVLQSATDFIRLSKSSASGAVDMILQSDDPFFNLWSAASFVLAFINDTTV